MREWLCSMLELQLLTHMHRLHGRIGATSDRSAAWQAGRLAGRPEGWQAATLRGRPHPSRGAVAATHQGFRLVSALAAAGTHAIWWVTHDGVEQLWAGRSDRGGVGWWQSMGIRSFANGQVVLDGGGAGRKRGKHAQAKVGGRGEVDTRHAQNTRGKGRVAHKVTGKGRDGH